MTYTSLAIVGLTCEVLCASAVALPLSLHVHLHPSPAVRDERVSLTLVNEAPMFQDVLIGGRQYTVRQHGSLSLRAPAGTRVYAASGMQGHHRGDVLLSITPAVEGQRLELR